MVTKKGRKITGRKYIKQRKKKKYEIQGQKKTVKIGEEVRKTKRTRGGNKKAFLTSIKFVNVRLDNKILKTKVKNVIETPSNRFLARQKIVTKGAIVETEAGKVKITNRPSQDGVANGILIK